MEALRIYRISDRYIRFLHSRDGRVQYNKNSRRPYVGVVLIEGSYKYFVPMESPKPNHANIKSGKHIMQLDGGRLGLLGFNNMVPVRDSEIAEINFAAEPDKNYALLLSKQAAFCNRNRAKIMEKASQTYYDAVNGKNKFLVQICCDFKALEKACRQFDPTRNNKGNA